jgi:hypothetical protein
VLREVDGSNACSEVSTILFDVLFDVLLVDERAVHCIYHTNSFSLLLKWSGHQASQSIPTKATESN